MSDRTNLLSRKTSSLTTSADRTQATDFRKYNKHRGKDFRSIKASTPVKVPERNGKKFELNKSVKRNY